MSEIQTWEKIGERTLSGKGTYRLPIADIEKIRCLSLFVDVIRKPSSEYKSKKTEPERSFYGYVNLLQDDYVIKTLPIEFERTRFDFYASIDGFPQTQLRCTHQELLQTIANLAVALGVPPTFFQHETKDWERTVFLFDTVQFAMYSSTAVKLTVKGLKYDDCEEVNGKLKSKKPPPPVKPVSYNRTEPVPIDSPFPEDNESEYDPDPLDESGIVTPQTYQLVAEGIVTAQCETWQDFILVLGQIERGSDLPEVIVRNDPSTGCNPGKPLYQQGVQVQDIPGYDNSTYSLVTWQSIPTLRIRETPSTP